MSGGLFGLFEMTGILASMPGVRPAAISQARAWLAASWRQYGGGAESEPKSITTPAH